MDPPGPRAAHAAATATSGGVAVIAAAAVGYALSRSAAAAPPASHATTAALAAASALGALGALDDLLDLSAALKLVLGGVAAGLLAIALPRVITLPMGFGFAPTLAPWVAVFGATLWLITVANAVNFIDGADGLAAGGMAIAFLTLAAGAVRIGDAPVAAAALAAAAALLGFLPWNLTGRLFQGDAGALFSGLAFAGLHLAAATRRDGPQLPLLFGPLALLPALTDVLLTLLARARRRRPLFQAHREHLYQRWIEATGQPHRALAWRGWTAMAGAGAAALTLQSTPPSLQPAIFALALTTCVAAWWAIRRRLGGFRRRA